MKGSCWCINASLDFFSEAYSQCSACNTLVSLQGLSDKEVLVLNDDSDFYGKQYWLNHQKEDLGYPDIFKRARADLIERNLHWLNTLLKYKLPKARALELGCSHGSFVALMNQTSYEASGVELSPWVVNFASTAFAVPVSVGPIESLQLEPQSLDVIVMMDVLEHLPDPMSTLSHCISLLKTDGLILIQTPQFKPEMRYEALVASSARFLEQLKADEHLYLFSKESLLKLFQSLGFEYIEFEPAIFGHYDMCAVVSRKPLRHFAPEQIHKALLSTPGARFSLALLDLKEQVVELQCLLAESEADRAARLVQINLLSQPIHVVLVRYVSRFLRALRKYISYR